MMDLRKRIIAGIGLVSFGTALYFMNTDKHSAGTRIAYGVMSAVLAPVCLYQVLKKERSRNRGNEDDEDTELEPRNRPQNPIVPSKNSFSLDNSDRRQVNDNRTYNDNRQVHLHRHYH